jgi:hypothetical protein
MVGERRSRRQGDSNRHCQGQQRTASARASSNHQDRSILARGEAYTNTTEGFFSLLKRGINGRAPAQVLVRLARLEKETRKPRAEGSGNFRLGFVNALITLVNWAGRSLRDWRVWALTLTIQWSGVRAVVKYGPWPVLLLPIIIVAAFIVYGACLHGPLVPWMRRIGSRLVLVGGALCVVAAVNLLVYPRVDALKFQGRGSDEDNALVDTAERLVTGQRPVYVATYLGNTPSVGLGWAALVAPLAVTGTIALLTPIALGLLVWMVRRDGGGDSATALALLLPMTSPGFWELSVSGSDLFAIGVLFVVTTACAARWRSLNLATAILGVTLVVAAASSRVAFAYVTASIAAFMWRMKRSGALLAGAATAAVVAGEYWVWWQERDGASPLYLVSKLAGLLGAVGVGLAVLIAFVSAAWALAQLDDNIDAWFRGLWALLAMPLAVVSFGVLAALAWDAAAWQAASYVEVAVPAAIACVAISAGRTADAPIEGILPGDD